MNNLENLEKRIKAIEERNRRVENDKAWETSNFRKISVAVTTYIIITIVMYFLGFENIFIGALIPTFGFLLSTLSINLLKNIYLKKYRK